MKSGAARLVFRDLPFLGEESRWAAVAGRLAAQQGRFWLLHDYLFANQLGENTGSYTPERLMTMLREEIRKQGKPFGLYFENIEGGFTQTGRTQPNAFNVLPNVMAKAQMMDEAG